MAVEKGLEEKRALEKSAIELFISLHKKVYGSNYRLLKLQERPDGILEDDHGNRLGIEVSHLFYDEYGAKLLLGKADVVVYRVESFTKYIDELNTLLRKKSETATGYKIDFPFSLLIRETSPVWTMEDFLEAKAHIHLPENVYQDIWLLTPNKGQHWCLLRLSDHKDKEGQKDAFYGCGKG